jgi:hypothetical protein
LALKQGQTLERQKLKMATQNAAQNAAIADLTREVDCLRALLNIDGSNSGIPTGMIPLNKNKVIPNSR